MTTAIKAIAKSMGGRIEDLREILPNILEAMEFLTLLTTSNFVTIQYYVVSTGIILMSRKTVERLRDQAEVGILLLVLSSFSVMGVSVREEL